MQLSLDLDELFASRAYKAKQLGRAHAIASDICEYRSKMFAVPTIIMSSIVAGSAIATLGDFGKAKLWLDLVICILSLIVAILTGLQQFLDYPGRSLKHKQAAADLAAIGRKWESDLTETVQQKHLDALENELSVCIKGAPHVSQELQQRAHEAILEEYERAKQKPGQQQSQQQQQA